VLTNDRKGDQNSIKVLARPGDFRRAVPKPTTQENAHLAGHLRLPTSRNAFSNQERILSTQPVGPVLNDSLQKMRKVKIPHTLGQTPQDSNINQKQKPLVNQQ
jgi:hypothetical protein